jgi:2-polyprenyl-3-methyl-5-hydroxy-6-metoxy-1,4-benzoquinol methylase
MEDTPFVCNLCGSTQAHRVPFRYLFKQRFLWLMECDKCTLRSIWPRPTQPEIVEMYAADYFTQADPATHHMRDEYVKLLNQGNFDEGAQQIKKYCTSGNVLEIGCATGNFLHALKQNGFEVKGIELSEFAVQYAKKHFGIDILNKPFDDALLGNYVAENEFDIVIMGDVLEHFTHPTQALQLVHTILKPGGVAIINLPGTLNLLSSKLAFGVYKLLGSQKTMTIPPYHLTEFSPTSFTAMAKHAGFERIVIKQEVKHPRTITLRGTTIENAIKLAMQYPNYYFTKWFGIDGDRMNIEVFKNG